MFLQKKPCMILLAIARTRKPYISMLMKEADTTFAHTTNILSDMESYGLVEFVSEGRIKYVKLTSTGKEVARSLKAIDDTLNGKSVLRGLMLLERRLDNLEMAVKGNARDDKTLKRWIKRYDAITAKLESLKGDAVKFENDSLDVIIGNLIERLDYLKTKLQKDEAGAENSFRTLSG